MAPIGSEIANGISETPTVEPAPVASEEVVSAPVEVGTPTTQAAPSANTNIDVFKEELIRDITAAVDKYVENIKLSSENQELRKIIAELSSKLNS